jgi:hypothetical protein
MSSFGQAIAGFTTPFNGFLGQESRTGGGDPFIVSKPADLNNANNISAGDAVMLLPNNVGGTYKQLADWQANGGNNSGLALNVSFNNASAIVTIGSGGNNNLAGIAPGMFVSGAGIPAGTYIASMNAANNTFTLNKVPTGNNNANQVWNFAYFAGWAVREVKTNLGYPYAPGTGSVCAYQPGEMVGVLVRGGITLKIPVGGNNVVAGGPAYLRFIANGGIPAGVVGGVEATPDGNNSILLANVPAIAEAYFKTGSVDGNNLVEVAVLSRIQV